MASPKTAINRFDLSMSYGEFNLLNNRKGFIGLQALPAIGVAKQSSTFAKVTVESVLRPIEDTRRAPKGAYKRGDFEWTTDSYATEDHGVEEVIDDRILAMYGSEIRAEQIHTQRAVNRVLMAFENAAAAAVFNTSTWTGSLTTALGTKWDVKASADPIADIDAAIDSCKATSGAKPNTLIVTDLAMRSLKRTDRVEDLLKYSGKDDPKHLGAITGLKDLLDLEQILVADGFKNTADEGQDASFSRLWDTTMAMVCHVNTDSDDLEDPTPNVGRTIMWTEENLAIPGADDTEPGLIIEEYREENRRGGVLRARFDRVLKILHAEAGHLLTGVL